MTQFECSLTMSSSLKKLRNDTAPHLDSRILISSNRSCFIQTRQRSLSELLFNNATRTVLSEPCRFSLRSCCRHSVTARLSNVYVSLLCVRSNISACTSSVVVFISEQITERWLGYSRKNERRPRVSLVGSPPSWNTRSRSSMFAAPRNRSQTRSPDSTLSLSTTKYQQNSREESRHSLALCRNSIAWTREPIGYSRNNPMAQSRMLSVF